MKIIAFCVLVIAECCAGLFAQKPPDGYILQYAQNFSSGKGRDDFWYSHPSRWTIGKTKDNFFLALKTTQAADPQEDSLAVNRCIIKNATFGDFVLEADIRAQPETKEICFVLDLRDSTRYYLIRLSNKGNDSLQGIYLVKNSIPKKISASTSDPVEPAPDEWHKIRIERNITTRTIRVFRNDMLQPVLEVKDFELIMGRIGFGSAGSPVCFDNISVWAPTVIPEEDLMLLPGH